MFNDEIGRPERAIIVVDATGIVRYIDVHQLREVPDAEEIAQELEISVNTVKKHLASAFDKRGLRSRRQTMG